MTKKKLPILVVSFFIKIPIVSLKVSSIYYYRVRDESIVSKYLEHGGTMI